MDPIAAFDWEYEVRGLPVPDRPWENAEAAEDRELDAWLEASMLRVYGTTDPDGTEPGPEPDFETVAAWMEADRPRFNNWLDSQGTARHRREREPRKARGLNDTIYDRLMSRALSDYPALTDPRRFVRWLWTRQQA